MNGIRPLRLCAKGSKLWTLCSSSMETLLPVIEKNPNKSIVPEHIAMPGEGDSAPMDESTEFQYGVNWARLQPPGPLSLYLWSTNPEYRAGTEAQRRTALHEIIIKFMERVQKGEVGSSRKISKSKMTEALNVTIENASEETFDALERAVSVLGNVQWVRINENEKKATFIPEDLRLWSMERPTLWTRERYRSAGEWQSATGFSLKHLGKWIADRENDGWIFEYPIAEGTLEQLKTEWNSLGRGLPKTTNEKGKPLKEDYAKALGRVQVYKYLQA